MAQNELLQKLEVFIRKYYKNLLIRGSIFFIGLLIVTFLLVAALEHFGRYNSGVRTVLFYTFLSCTLVLAYRFLFIPISGLLKMGKRLSHEEAADLIGKHFHQVGDKIINTLQLQKQALSGNAFLLAAIDQKTQNLKPFAFDEAIDFKQNKRYAPYGLIPLLVLLVVYIFEPELINDTPNRIVHYNAHFPAPAPFSFHILNDSLTAEEHTDFELQVDVAGKALPEDVSLVIEGNRYLMQKENKHTYRYTFRNVRKNIPFLLVGSGYESQQFELKVAAIPVMQQWQLKLVYPAYTRKKSELLTSPSDIVVPYGTQATWTLFANHTGSVDFVFNGKSANAQKQSDKQYSLKKQLRESATYQILLHHPNNGLNDSMQYTVQIIADEYPKIDVAEQADSIGNKVNYFAGEIQDDYGLTRLTFNYHILKSDDKERMNKKEARTILIPSNELQHRFYYEFDLNTIQIAPGEEVEYFFEVWDNDGVRGAKSSRSQVMLHKAPSMEELLERRDNAAQKLTKEMEAAMLEAKKLQREMKELDQKMAEKKELTWEEKKKLEQLLERQKQLQKKMEQIKQQQKENVQKEEEFNKQSEELLEKQKQIDKLFEELLSDELKKLIQQTQQMLNNQNKDQIKKELDKLQMNNKDVEKELDRMLEQFKQMEVEKKLDESINKLNEIKEKQQQLAEKTEKLQNDNKLNKVEKKQQLEDIKKEQEKLNQEFADWQKKTEELRKENEKLEQPNEIADTKEEEKSAGEKQQESSKELENNKPEKAAQKQKEAAQKMEEMSEKLQEGKQDEKEKEDEINAEALREILENTIQLSKDQEALMDKMNSINGYSPQFVEAAKEQKNISDNAKIIEDSLQALSKRVPQISSYINREVTKMRENLDRTVSAYSQRNFGEVRYRQQSAMTSANNLGVMMSEILKQMQMEMQANSGKKGGKNKPGKGKGNSGKQPQKGMGDLKKMQEELNKQLREGLNKQQQQGGNKPGEKQGGMSSQDFARMAAQQQAIRQQMQKLMNEMGAKEKEGMGGNKAMQEMQRMMEQTEKDLYNKQLSSEMIQRQQEIMTRMLESEKAEKQREQDKKREAEQAKEKNKTAPPDFSPYFKQKQKETELLQTIPAELQPYYRQKVKDYFNKISTP
jgi:hypothetical protein